MYTFAEIRNVEQLCEDGFTILQDEVNTILKTFNESVSIEISEEDNYSIKIIDSTKNIESKQEIVTYFNEAKANLICILILLNVILLAKENGKKQILVLDDFITSLDSSNRTYLIKYIFEKFADFQIFILTHNISFYNLTMFMINKINEQQNSWTYANLYEIANKHKIYQKPGMETVAIIKADYLQPVAPGTTIDIDGIGNRLRKKFEVFLYEFSKLLQIGAVEDSNNIIDRILNDKAAYYYDSKTAMDLIDDLEYILNHQNQYNLAGRLKNKINIFKRSDFGNFKQIVKNLKLYQKVTLHPMSHGVAGMATFTTKEIEESISLLEKMEGFLKDMIDKNVYTI